MRKILSRITSIVAAPFLAEHTPLPVPPLVPPPPNPPNPPNHPPPVPNDLPFSSEIPPFKPFSHWDIPDEQARYAEWRKYIGNRFLNIARTQPSGIDRYHEFAVRMALNYVDSVNLPEEEEKRARKDLKEINERLVWNRENNQVNNTNNNLGMTKEEIMKGLGYFHYGFSTTRYLYDAWTQMPIEAIFYFTLSGDLGRTYSETGVCLYHINGGGNKELGKSLVASGITEEYCNKLRAEADELQKHLDARQLAEEKRSS